jgi:hypothetical protein
MKAQKVRDLIAQENYKAALCGAKDFRIGVTKEQRSAMARAYECFNFPSFYKQLGIDIDVAKADGIKVLKEVV